MIIGTESHTQRPRKLMNSWKEHLFLFEIRHIFNEKWIWNKQQKQNGWGKNNTRSRETWCLSVLLTVLIHKWWSFRKKKVDEKQRYGVYLKTQSKALQSDLILIIQSKLWFEQTQFSHGSPMNCQIAQNLELFVHSVVDVGFFFFFHLPEKLCIHNFVWRETKY